MRPTEVLDATTRTQQDIQSIQKTILEGLYTAREASLEHSSDEYREHLLQKLGAGGRLWGLRLLAVPNDTDFIYCAYRVLLARKPDEAGFSQFARHLLLGHIRRTDLLATFLDSDEMRARPVQPQLRAILRWSQRIAAVPFFPRLLQLGWRLATLSEQTSRAQFMTHQLQQQVSTLNLRSIDAIEYLHNHAKK